MRPITSLSIALSLCLFFGAAASARATLVITTNQVANPGFEDGVLDPWAEDDRFTPTEMWTAVDDVSLANTGDWSAVVDGNNELRQDFTAFAEEIAMATGDVEVVQFDLFVRHPDSTATNTLITIFYDNGSEESKNYPTTSREWELVDLLPDLTPGLLPVGVSVFGNSSGRTFVDDFSLFAIPEPGSLALLMLGASGLLVRRRRIN